MEVNTRINSATKAEQWLFSLNGHYSTPKKETLLTIEYEDRGASEQVQKL
jgi:hypothetical protein